MGILGQVLYLIVSIPYLCILFLLYFISYHGLWQGYRLTVDVFYLIFRKLYNVEKKKMTSYVVIFCFLLAMQADTGIEAGYGKLINTFKTHTFNAARK